MRKIWLTRHGESMYNVLGKIGGDSRLSPRGEVYARLLPDLLVERVPLVHSLEPCWKKPTKTF
jgi:broad specificity phosphatase PhoE